MAFLELLTYINEVKAAGDGTDVQHSVAAYVSS